MPRERDVKRGFWEAGKMGRPAFALNSRRVGRLWGLNG